MQYYVDKNSLDYFVYGGIENMDKDTLEEYFDYEAFGRELEFDFTATSAGYIDVQWLTNKRA